MTRDIELMFYLIRNFILSMQTAGKARVRNVRKRSRRLYRLLPEQWDARCGNLRAPTLLAALGKASRGYNQ
jgi:hypothetical protein